MNEHNLENRECYFPEYNTDDEIRLLIDVFNMYNQLMKLFLERVRDVLSVTNQSYMKHIIIHGLKSLTHIFRVLLFNTKNTKLSYEYTNKALYYFIEFISQMGEENNSYLNLTPKDAGLFVYKKTIFNIVNEYIHRENNSETQQMNQLLHILTDILVLRSIKLISCNCFNSIHDIDTILVNIGNYFNIITNMLEKKISNSNSNTNSNTVIIKQLLLNIMQVEDMITDEEYANDLIIEHIIMVNNNDNTYYDNSYDTVDKSIQKIKDIILNNNNR
jgi:hypothetical protein